MPNSVCAQPWFCQRTRLKRRVGGCHWLDGGRIPTASPLIPEAFCLVFGSTTSSLYYQTSSLSDENSPLPLSCLPVPWDHHLFLAHHQHHAPPPPLNPLESSPSWTPPALSPSRLSRYNAPPLGRFSFDARGKVVERVDDNALNLPANAQPQIQGDRGTPFQHQQTTTTTPKHQTWRHH